MNTLLKMALRNIFRQKQRTIITVLSMLFGYALLSVSLSVGEGSYNVIIRQFTDNNTGHIQIHHQDYLNKPSINRDIKKPEDIYNQINQTFPKARISSRIKGSALAYGKKRVLPVPVVGIQPNAENQVTQLAKKVKEGHYFPNSSNQELAPALVGKKLAGQLQLGIGDELVLISSGADGSIANDVYQVSGIVGSEESMAGNQVYLNLQDARNFFSMPSSVHEIIIALTDYTQARQGAVLLQNATDTLKNLAVDPWQSVEKDFYRSMEADKQGNNVTMLIIMFMVGVSVLNTVLMSVFERMREYGLLRAIGVKPNRIISLVLLESSILSALGCIGGFFLALPVNYWFQEVGVPLTPPFELGGMLFDRITGEISLYTMLFPSALVFTTAVLVSLLPALRAARVSPIEVLAHD